MHSFPDLIAAPRPDPARPFPVAPAPLSLTVSIVSHGQVALVDPLIRQLARQCAPGLITRLVLTLNLPESLPDDWSRLGAFDLVVRRNASPAGFAANHNRALADQTEGLVAVLNPDLSLEADPLSRLCAAASQPGVGLAVPRVLEADGQEADSARALPTPSSILSRQLLGLRRPARLPAWYAGMCMVLPAAAWQAMGGFDERFRMYCEDFDLCARLRLAGYQLVQVPEARMTHVARRSSHRALRPLAWHLSSLLRVWSSSTYRDYQRLLAREARAPEGHQATSGTSG